MRRTRFILLLAMLTPMAAARGQLPPDSGALAGVGVDQHLGATLPLDATFRDEAGRTVRLRDYFHGRPVLLTLVYFDCPMLCTLTLNQLTRSLNGLHESAGERFDVLTISFNPNETPQLASAKKATYLHTYRRPSASDGWHFLTGDQASIDAVTRAVGFRYRWDAQQQAYAHASALLALTPDARISRYFLGVDYPPTEVRAAIDAADRGTIGSASEAVYFYCFRYDPASGRYGVIITRALRLLGLFTVAGLIILIAWLHRLSARRYATERLLEVGA